MATFVLVHGAWHGGWCWRKLVPLLQAAGHTVYTPTLTGLGERSHLLTPSVNLSTHVTDIANVLTYEDLHDVLLVGHSYGGMVTTGVAGRVPERLAQLIYLDAFVPEDGQSLVDLRMPAPTILAETASGALAGAGSGATDEGWYRPAPRAAPWEEIVREDYLVTDPEDVRWMCERLGPQPSAAQSEPVRCHHPAAARLPRTYIRCARYPNPAFDRLAARASAPDSGWQRFDLATSHDAMVTAPRELAEILLALV